MRIAVLGGTGSFGTALARRLVAAGADVLIGSREVERARATAEPLGAEGGTNDDVARRAELVVLAVKAEAAVDTARKHARAVGRTPLLCVASELRFGRDGVRPSEEARSVAERVAGVVEAPVVAGLHSLAASNLAGDEPPDEDTLVCGDDAEAKELVLGVAEKLVAGRAIDAGPLAVARALEGLTAVIVNVNKRYRAHAGVRVTGLP